MHSCFPVVVTCFLSILSVLFMTFQPFTLSMQPLTVIFDHEGGNKRQSLQYPTKPCVNKWLKKSKHVVFKICNKKIV